MSEIAPTVSVIVLAYGEEPHLPECIASLLAADDVDEVVVVDNGAAQAVAELPQHELIRVVVPETNLGFAGGCHFGVSHASGDLLVFVNSDVRVDAAAISRLAAATSASRVGMACAQVLLADQPEQINSLGNPITFLMFSWAGEMGSPRVTSDQPLMPTGITGATFAIRRAVWDELGGFDPEYFAYGEDTDLSVRAYLAGYSIICEPAAVSWHYYEFGRNPRKLYLLERNRLITLVSVYEWRTLLPMSPAIALAELGLIAVSLRDGWLTQKLAGYRWLWRNRKYLADRRARVRRSRVRTDAELVRHLRARFDPPPAFGMAIPDPVNRLFSATHARVSRRLDRLSLTGQRD